MAKTVLLTAAGKAGATKADLNDDIFDLKVVDTKAIQIAYEGYLANGRKVSARTLTRGEVRGGGKKPWKQKGTGRARHGSTRSPIWRTGGVTFGPRGIENYTRTLPKKAKRLAIKQALSLKQQAGNVIVSAPVELKEAKTKEMASFLSAAGADRGVVYVVSDITETHERAARNIPYLTVVQAMYLNVYTIMNAHTIIIEKSAVADIETWLGGETDA